MDPIVQEEDPLLVSASLPKDIHSLCLHIERGHLSRIVRRKDGQLDPAAPVLRVPDPLRVAGGRLPEHRLFGVLAAVRLYARGDELSQPWRLCLAPPLERIRYGVKQARIVCWDDAPDHRILAVREVVRGRRRL